MFLEIEKKMTPLVTVCITTYNRKKLLPITLKSVMAQTYDNIEIIIVDDCSNDGTEELVTHKLLSLDERIKYCRHETNKGLAAGRNTAISNANGKYFTFCDDDDKWQDNFVEEFIKVAEHYDESWCFSCGSEYCDSLVNIFYKGYTPPVAGQFYYLASIKKVGGYNDVIRSGVDHDLWIRLASKKLNILGLEQKLSIPNTQISNNRMTKNQERRIDGIRKSLITWKPLICETFSEKFYDFFKNNYMYCLNKNFLIQNVRLFDLKKVVCTLCYINKMFFLKDLIRYIASIFHEKKTMYRSTFFSYFQED